MCQNILCGSQCSDLQPTQLTPLKRQALGLSPRALFHSHPVVCVLRGTYVKPLSSRFHTPTHRWQPEKTQQPVWVLRGVHVWWLASLICLTPCCLSRDREMENQHESHPLGNAERGIFRDVNLGCFASLAQQLLRRQKVDKFQWSASKLIDRRATLSMEALLLLILP